MLLKSKLVRLFCAICLTLALAALAFADTIRLKDGSIIKGKIISFNGGKFVVVIGDGSRQRQMTFFADEIESIEFDSTAMPIAENDSKVENPVNPTPANNNKTDNSKIITVGQTDKNTTPPKVITTDNTNPVKNDTPKSSPALNPKPIVIPVKVLADNTSNGWTNSGWVVRKGQKIKITAKGRVSLGNGRYTTPEGIVSLPDGDKLIKSKPTGGLIAVIGDDNNDFIFIGDSFEFVAARDGSLFLGVNEGNLDDNTGAFDVSVEIDPNTYN